MGASLGILTLDLVAKIGGFTGPMDKAERKSRKTSRSIRDDNKRIDSSFSNSLKTSAKWAGGIAIGAGAAAVAFTKMSLKTADEIGKVAKTAGVTTDTIQEMRHAASLSGIAFGDLDKGMQQFNKRVGELRAGTGALYTYLSKTDKALMSQVQSARSTDEALDLVFKAMQKVASSSDRAALAAAAFGRSGQRITIMADDYERLRKEARDLGLVIDKNLIANAEEANDKLDTMSRIIQTQLISSVIELAPEIQKLAQYVSDLARDWVWLLGGQKRSNEKQRELEVVRKEMQELIKLQNEWKEVEQTQLALKAQKGTLFNPETLLEAQNNIATITEMIKDLNAEQNNTTSNKKPPAIVPADSKDTSWSDLGDVLKETSDINNQRLELIRKSNIAIRNENEKQLQEDIARDIALRQLQDDARVAELNNISDDHEREIALHEHKFEKLKKLYAEGSEELTAIERLEAAERMKIESERAQSISSSAASMFSDMTAAAENFGHNQTILYRVMFAASQAFRVAEATANMFQAISNAGASGKSVPESISNMAVIGSKMAAVLASISAVGMAHDGMDYIPQTGTWLLNKGERVTTEKTSRKLDNTLSRIQSDQQYGAPGKMNVNIYEARGTSAQVTQRDDGSLDVEIALIEEKMTERMHRGTGMAKYLDRRYGRKF